MSDQISKTNLISSEILKLASELNKAQVKWLLASSCSLFVRGINVIPNDIDLVVDMKDFNKLTAIFSADNFSPVITDAFNGNPFKKTSFNRGECNVEFLRFDISQNIIVSVDFLGETVYVNSLEDELKYYKTRPGKEDIVRLIEAKLLKLP